MSSTYFLAGVYKLFSEEQAQVLFLQGVRAPVVV
jgi:hypothetical protein